MTEYGAQKPMRRAISAFLVASVIVGWAVLFVGTAHLRAQRIKRTGGAEPAHRHASVTTARAGQQSRPRVPGSVRFREVEGRGLLVKTWINGAGPYSFAVDTGAGAMLLSQRVAQEARVAVIFGRDVKIGGLSGANATGQQASLRNLALGYQDNYLPAKGLVLITDRLPPDLDGVLDPTEAYWPLGYVINIPEGELSAFDPRLNPLRVGDAAPGGTVVPWLFDAESRRPFVMLTGGRRALIDTGSGFGVAVTEEAARALGILTHERREKAGVRDLGGGRIAAHRVRPATVSIGLLDLRNVPTDLLSSAEAGAPILLGRDALRPFHLTFDPIHRLIRIQPQ